MTPSTAARNVADVLSRISTACSKASPPPTRATRLVAVSKTKPVEQLQEVYDAGHKIFGETTSRRYSRKRRNCRAISGGISSDTYNRIKRKR